MGIFKRIFGICETKLPTDKECWKLSSDTTIQIELEKTPELLTKGSAIRIEGKNLSERILVVFGDDGKYYAFINKCPHAKRRIDPVKGEMLVRCCSIGKSTFNYKGELISGSTKESLEVLKIGQENNKLIISL